MPLCVKLQQQAQYSNWDVGSIGGQYGSASPRCELYALLLALVLVPSPRWPAPLSCAVCVFSQGRRDRNITVSTSNLPFIVLFVVIYSIQCSRVAFLRLRFSALFMNNHTDIPQCL